MRIVVLVQARLQSTRLPGKVLYELDGQPVLGLILQRLRQCRSVQEVLVATGDCPENRPVKEVAERYGVRVFLGPEDDVLKRFFLAAGYAEADAIVRVTADCPLVDPGLIDNMVAAFLSDGYDYVTNVRPPSWPDGLDISVFKRDLLEKADREAIKHSERQHVVPWMWEAVWGPKALGFRGLNIAATEDLSRHRWVLDEPRDYSFFLALLRHLDPGTLHEVGWKTIVEILKAHPEVPQINFGIIRDEGLLRDQLNDASSGKLEGQ